MQVDIHWPQGVALDDPDRILTEAEYARFMGISPRTAQRQRVHGGGAPFCQISERRIGYRLGDVRAWIASRSRRSTSANAAA